METRQGQVRGHARKRPFPAHYGRSWLSRLLDQASIFSRDQEVGHGPDRTGAVRAGSYRLSLDRGPARSRGSPGGGRSRSADHRVARARAGRNDLRFQSRRHCRAFNRRPPRLLRRFVGVHRFAPLGRGAWTKGQVRTWPSIALAPRPVSVRCRSLPSIHEILLIAAVRPAWRSWRAARGCRPPSLPRW
jgi:hypothetical protein